MVKVEQIDGRIAALSIDGFVTCWLIRDHRLVLVEAGPPACHADLVAGLRQLSLSPEQLDFLVITHIHIDHVGAAGYLARANARLKIFVHRSGVKHLLDPTVLLAQVRGAYAGTYNGAEMLPITVPERIVAVGTGERIELGESFLDVCETPGHARHHVVYFDPASDGVFAGDALGSFYPGHPSFVLAPPPDYDRELAKRSIATIRARRSRRIYFTHGGLRELGEPFYEELAAKHDLWTARVREILQNYPEAADHEILAQFLMRIPELAAYPDQLFSFRLSVRGILGYIRKTRKSKGDVLQPA